MSGKPPAGLSARLRLLAALLRDAPASSGARGRLLWRNDRREIMSLALPERLVIGRDARCDLTLANPRISRRHCEIVLLRGLAWVCDLGSTNGTRLNGRAITAATPLRDGDIIQLGGECLAYVE
jgi:hypothetical protein